MSSDELRISADPFYVPDRTEEIRSFAIGMILTAFIPVVLLQAKLTSGSMLLMGTTGLIAATMLWSGLRSRSYRIARARTVAELRAAMVTPDRAD